MEDGLQASICHAKLAGGVGPREELLMEVWKEVWRECGWSKQEHGWQ